MNHEREQELEDVLERLKSAYIAKRRIYSPSFHYIRSDKYDRIFLEAANLCLELNIDPLVYVESRYTFCTDKAKFFPTALIGSRSVIKKLTNEELSKDEPVKDLSKREEYKNAVVYAEVSAIPPDKLLAQQIDLLRQQVNNCKRDLNDILLDSELTLFGWFRILATKDRNEQVIEKYKKIAKAEVTPKMKKFLKEKGFDLERIFD